MATTTIAILALFFISRRSLGPMASSAKFELTPVPNREQIRQMLFDSFFEPVAEEEANRCKQQRTGSNRIAGEEPKLVDDPVVDAQAGKGAEACSDNQPASGFVHRAAPRNGRHFIVVQKAARVNSARRVAFLEVADVLHFLFAVADAEDVTAGRFDGELAHAPGL
jgi:hypothetical protein